jgi:hypothetical protein
MNIKKVYTFTNSRQIWRVIPASGNRLVIEDRDAVSREAFFNCIDMNTGDRILENHQFDEKFWLGIEDIYENIIFFYRYMMPNMPQHMGIIAFDINKKSIIWEQPDYTFSFISDGRVICYKQRFEGRDFYLLDINTGELIEELGNDNSKVHLLKENTVNILNAPEFLFPEQYYDGKDVDEGIKEFLTGFSREFSVQGAVEFLVYKDVIMLNIFEPNDNGMLKNVFRVFDFKEKQMVFTEILNSNANAAVPDSFFMKNNLLFLLQEKSTLLVCSVD